MQEDRKSDAFQRLQEAFSSATDGICGSRPEDSLAVKRAVFGRSKELGSYLRQLARLVRLASLCTPRSYVEFFYVRVGEFSRDNFHRAVQECRPDKRAVRIEGDGIVFLEPAMRSGSSDGFDLRFAQLPRLAILLDVLHYALGYEALYRGEAARDPKASAQEKGLFAPLLSAEPEATADEVAQRLQSVFGKFLSEALGGTTYEQRQFQAIASFLKERSALAPEAIDDHILFDFWRGEAAADDRSESLGFKLYQLAVRSVLRFRRALAAERAENATAYSFGTDEGQFNPDRVEHRPLAEEDWHGGREHVLAGGDNWQSPLIALTTAPCDSVKWLNKAERQRLANLLEEKAETDEPDYVSLMGPDRFDVGLAHTLLRVDVFAPVQAAIVGALRRQKSGGEAVAAALTPIGEDIYEEARRGYLAIREGVREAMLAALHFLGNEGDERALLLIDRLYGPEAIAHFASRPDDESAVARTGHISDEKRQAMQERLRAAFGGTAPAPDAIVAIVREAKSAAGKLRREGFRPEQQADPTVRAAFQQATAALDTLVAELDRLDRRLAELPLAEVSKADQAAFAAAFQEIYGA
jgi:hypothetical protein